MGGDGTRARRRPRPLGFPGVARRVAFALAAVQFATCAALASETARGLDGGEGADGGTAAAPAADPPSTLTQDAPAPAAPAVEDATPRAGAMDASGAPDLGPSAPLLDASLATVCAAKGAWEAFDNEVLRQTNASHVEARVCVTDAEEGSAAAAAAAAEALAAAKREALAKKKEKEKEKKIPSLRDFKSDLEAKVADARDAKKGKKEAEQREKDLKEGGDAKEARDNKEAREAEAEGKKRESTRKDEKDGEKSDDEEKELEPSDVGYEPVPTPSSPETNAVAKGAASATISATTASPPDGGQNEAFASPVPKPTPTATHAEGVGIPAGTGERGSPDGAAYEQLDSGPTSSPPEASGEPSVEPTPVSLAAFVEDATGAAREAEATPIAERLDVDSGTRPSPDDPRESESQIDRRDDDGPPSPTTEAVPHCPGSPSDAEGSDAERADALGATDASVSTDSEESDADAIEPEPIQSEPTESDLSDETVSRQGFATPVPVEVREKYASEVNYAAASNGAKVVSANPESKSTAGAALKENKDSYYLSPCLTSREEGKWITVELSEEIAVTAVTVANYEFHSSAPRHFEVWGTAGPADKEDGYRLILTAMADIGREPQTFEVSPTIRDSGSGTWSKHVKFKFTSHYGSFHFCTLSLLRVHGKDATQTLKEEMEAIDAEAREVEAILRENDESFLREKEEAEARAKAEETEENARRESQAAARRVLETVRSAGKGETLSDAENGDRERRRATSEPDKELDKKELAPDDEKVSSRFSDGEDGEDALRRASAAESTRLAGATADGGPAPVSGTASSPDDARGGLSSKERVEENPSDEPPSSESRDGGRKSDVVVQNARDDTEDSPTTSSRQPPTDDVADDDTNSPEKDKEKRDKSEPTSESRSESRGSEKRDDAEKKSSPSSSENVFSIMAKKIKALELNQSMFDRYVEASNARVADRLDDVSADLEMAEESAVNAAARVEETSRAARLAAERRANELERRLETLERETRRDASRHRAALGVLLFVFASITTLFASVALLDAAQAFSIRPSKNDIVASSSGESGEARISAEKVVGSDEERDEERKSLGTVPAGVGVGGLDRSKFVKRETLDDDDVSSTVSVSKGSNVAVSVSKVFTSIDRALRSTKERFAGLEASAEDARNARVVAGIIGLLIASLCAFCGCAIFFVPIARVFSASFVSFLRRFIGSARTVAARLAREGGLLVKALIERVARWRLGGGGE